MRQDVHKSGTRDMLTAIAVFGAATTVVLLVGPAMARTADRLAKATGMGGALFGVVFLALATDLPELTLTPTAVLGGTPKIAIGNLLGSGAAQLVLIAVMDIVYRKGQLYGRVRLLPTVAQCALMMSVLAVPLLVAAGGPSLGGVGAGTLLLPLTYLGTLHAIRRIGRPQEGGTPGNEHSNESTTATDSHSLASLWLRFGVFALLLGGAGVALERTTGTLGAAIGIGETAAGALLAGIVTSLPELVTGTAAVRAGALQLAVGDLVGSSALDVALLSVADVFYFDGSVFELLGKAEFTLIGVALALTFLLVLGVVRRKQDGSSRVGVESYLMIAVYVVGAAILVSAG